MAEAEKQRIFRDFNDDDLKAMADEGRRMDIDSWRKDRDENQHYMKESVNQTTQDARKNAEKFVNDQLKLAREYRKIWDSMASETRQQQEDKDLIRQRMIIELARALHTVMDSTSPAHADKHGWPVAYVGINKSLHSPTEH